MVSAEGEQITITDSAKRGFQGLKIYGKTTQNGTPSPDNPIPLESVGGDGEVVTTVGGGNMFDFNTWKQNAVCINSTTSFDENSVTIAATNNDAYVVNDVYKVPVVGGKTYTICFDKSDTEIDMTSYLFKNGIVDSSMRYYYGSSYTFVADADAEFYTVRFGVIYAGDTVTISNIGFYKGNAKPYEPYTEPQQLITSTPNGLCGIPVSSGGNYTDENGQRWICDEIDYERGVLIKRTGLGDLGTLNYTMYLSYNAASIGGITKPYGVSIAGYSEYIVSKESNQYGDIIFYYKEGAFTDAASFKSAMSGVMLCYELATPTETPLSAEDIAEYKKLHTNYPTTVITSEGYANVKYVADTKIYIDNKFAQLATQIVNNA